MKKYKRKSVLAELEKYDVLCKEGAYIEVTEWHNSDGFDIEIYNGDTQKFSLTYGELKALKKLVKTFRSS